MDRVTRHNTIYPARKRTNPLIISTVHLVNDAKQKTQLAEFEQNRIYIYMHAAESGGSLLRFIRGEAVEHGRRRRDPPWTRARSCGSSAARPYSMDGADGIPPPLDEGSLLRFVRGEAVEHGRRRRDPPWGLAPAVHPRRGRGAWTAPTGVPGSWSPR